MGKRMIILSIRFILSKSEQLTRQNLPQLSRPLIYRIAILSNGSTVETELMSDSIDFPVCPSFGLSNDLVQV